jgi:shikimate 5-dehydrogenase
MSTRIAVLGLGAMGSRMAANLLKAGHEVTVWNRTPSAAAALVAICGFGEKEIFRPNVTMEVQRAWDRHGDVSVQVNLDGAYDKTGLPDPLILSFNLSVRGGQITQLIIIHNKTKSEP